MTESLADLRAFYRLGDDVHLTSLPAAVVMVTALVATGEGVEAAFDHGFVLRDLAAGTYAVQGLDERGRVLCEEFTTVAHHQGELAVHGFVTSYGDEDVVAALAWLKALRVTVVQFYDWMDTYSEPLGPTTGWLDPSRRPVSYDALRRLTGALDEFGAVAHAYAPIYAVGNDFAADHPELLMYEDNQTPVRFLDQIVLANPENVEWQEHFAERYGQAMDALGFRGLHVDTYGYPRVARDVDGAPIDVRAAYYSFLLALRDARPGDLISFNQVNGVPSAARLSAEPVFRYCEVWAPNDAWRHFEGLLDRSSGRAGQLGSSTNVALRGSLACYPPVWGIEEHHEVPATIERSAALRTVVLTEAIATCLGASALLYGDLRGALCDPYYPKHARLLDEEAAVVLTWHRFSLRCRDLFLRGEDTSWYEVNDVNGAVSVEASEAVSPEPLGGQLFARVVLDDHLVTVGLVDLTGSRDGTWSSPTAPGRLREATVTVLVDDVTAWDVAVAVLGAGDGRFEPFDAAVVAHRQGRAWRVTVPLEAGWSVVRMTRKVP